MAETGSTSAPGTEPRAKSRIGEAKVEKILDAALTVFARFGLRGARMDQIADAAGMSKPNLIYYFPSKDALYLAVLERTLDMWLEPLAGIDADADPRDAIAAYIDGKLDSARRFPENSRLFATEIIQGGAKLQDALKRDLAPLVAEKIRTIETWIAEGRLVKMEPVALLFLIWATTQHYADFAAQVRVLTGRGFDDPVFFETMRQTILKIVLDGILPR